MRSLKKLLAVLLALTMVLSIMVVPAFAAESLEYEDEAKVLYDLGLFKGTSATEYVPNLDARLERQEGVVLVLRLFGLEEEANAMNESEAKALLAEKFTDADEIGAWAVKAIAYAVENEIVNGRPDGKFAPKDPLLGKEFAKMILAELGQYDPNNFQTACADLAAVSDLSAAEAIRFNDKILIRDDVVGISFSSLAATYKDGDTVLGKLAAANEGFKAKAMELGLIEIVKINTVVEPISIKAGETVTLPEKAEVEYSDGSVAEVALTWDTSAVKTDVAGEYKAVGSVAGFDGTIEVAIKVAPNALEIESVTADNLKEIVVVYNQSVSGNAEAAKKENYTLDIGKSVTAVKVDGNTAVLTVEDGVANQKKAKLTINKILPAKEVKEFTFFDAELPEVTGLVVTGPKSIELSFTEPIAKPAVTGFTDAKVTIKSGTSTISINKTSIKGEGTRTLSIELYSSFVDGKEYEVTVENFVDYAGYKNKIETISHKYEKDASAPVATVDEAKQEYVKVTFNKPVTGLTPGHFSHTFSAWTGIQLTKGSTFGKDVITSADAVRTVYVWFYENGERTQKDERPIAEGDTSFRILTKNGTEIKDAWGNKFAEWNTTITVAADKAAPEVKEIKVTGEDRFTVEFTKTVNFKYSDNLEVLDSEGKAISGLTVDVSPAGADKKFTVILSKNLKGKSIIVNIKNVKDTTLNTNTLASYSTTLDIDDKTPPTVSKVNKEIVNAGKSDEARYLYIFFDEEVDAATALVAGNYFLKNGDKYTKLTGAVEFYAGNKIVRVALTKGQYDEIAATTDLFVTAVKDLAGNEISPEIDPVKNKIIAIDDQANAPEIAKAEATAVNIVQVTFNQELATYDQSAFTVDDKEIAGLDASVNSSGNTVLTLTLTDEGQLAHNTSAKKVKIVERNAITNIFGVNPANVPAKLEATIADKIKPEFSAVAAITNESGQFTIKFKEPMKNDPSLFPYMGLDLVVVRKSDSKVLQAGTQYKVIGLDPADSSKIVVQIDGVAKDDVYKVYSADAIQYIKDANNNLAKPFTSAKEVTVKGSDTIDDELRAAKDEADAIEATENKDSEQKAIYKAASFTDFVNAYAAAKILPETTNSEKVAKTVAIRAAIALLEKADA